jgi:hypothetical protein
LKMLSLRTFFPQADAFFDFRSGSRLMTLSEPSGMPDNFRFLTVAPNDTGFV